MLADATSTSQRRRLDFLFFRRLDEVATIGQVQATRLQAEPSGSG
jgi:hypothetical protein